MSTVIKVENLSKQYRLGSVGASTFKEDTQRWWAKLRGKEDPFLNLGAENDRTIQSDDKFVWSLRDINFDVQQGDVLGVIGRNGAGKSTLLKILSKVTAPTTGSVKVKGRIASLLEVGTGFHPELTGRENIYLNGAILGMRKQEITRKLDEIISFAGVEKYVDTPVKRYSSGMYVRLAFAVAAHLESEILIVDEVLAVGDVEFQKKCLGKMGEISKEHGRSILFVSHNIVSLQNLCNNGILLKNGLIQNFNEINNVVDSYYSEFKHIICKPIIDRIDRQGNKLVQIVDFKINNNDIEKGCKILCGEQLNFELTYQSVSNNFEGKFVLGIYDQFHNRILFLDSTLIKDSPKYFSKKGKISINLTDQFSLGIGDFSVNVAIFSNNELSDYIQSITYIKVLESDFYKSGKLPPSDTLLLVNQKWDFLKVTNI